MQISEYADDRGNRIEWDGPPIDDTNVIFTGSNNVLRVHSGARVGKLRVQFDCDNGFMEVGSSTGVPAFSATVRVGQDSRVIVGSNVSTTATAGISATEGTTVSIGEDSMLAIGVQLRADDGHPIFDVNSGKRVNISRDIIIGQHVWVGYNAAILGGVTVGSGAVIGLGSVVTKDVPNNAVAAGNPARVVRSDIAWERPHLSLVRPYYKPDASSIKKSRWWARTGEQTIEQVRESPRPRRRRLADSVANRLPQRLAARLLTRGR